MSIKEETSCVNGAVAGLAAALWIHTGRVSKEFVHEESRSRHTRFLAISVGNLEVWGGCVRDPWLGWVKPHAW